MKIKSESYWKLFIYETNFMKSWNYSPMLWHHHLKIGLKRLEFLYHVQLVVKILKSGTIITLAQKIFSGKKFLNFETFILITMSLFQNWNYQGRTYIYLRCFYFFEITEAHIDHPYDVRTKIKISKFVKPVLRSQYICLKIFIVILILSSPFVHDVRIRTFLDKNWG